MPAMRSRKRRSSAMSGTTRRRRIHGPSHSFGYADAIKGRNTRLSKRRRSRKGRRRTKRPKLARKVNKLVRFMNQQQAEHVRRRRDTGQLVCNLAESSVNNISSRSTIGDIEAACAQLRYFNPATNALVTQSGVTGTYSRDINLSIYRKIMVVNNYNVAVNVEIFSCFPRNATSIPPQQAWANGLADNGGLSQTSPLTYVSDSAELTDIWEIRKVCKGRLLPAQMKMCTATTPEFSYQIATADNHTLAYQRNQGGHGWLVRLVGSIGHDNTTSNLINTIPGGIDWMTDVTYKIKYDAGKDLKDYSVENNSGNITATPVINSKPSTSFENYASA